MLFLLFQLGSDRYAIEAKSAVEVVPLLALKRIPLSAPGVAGIFNYRGRPVPAIDLCALTLGRPARAQLSTRIIILRCELRVPRSELSHPEHGTRNAQLHLIGVIAERATRCAPLPSAPNLSGRQEMSGARGQGAGGQRPDHGPTLRAESPLSAHVAPDTGSTFLGPVLMDDKGFLQLVRPEHLLTETVREALFAQVESFSYEGD